MQPARSLQQLSDDIVAIASQIITMPQRLRNREISEFVRGTQHQRDTIVQGLALTQPQVLGLIVEAQAVGAIGPAAAMAVAPTRTEPELWDYDTKTATVEDLTRRRDLLRVRLSVLEYLRSH
jgi:hypothetical protein